MRTAAPVALVKCYKGERSLDTNSVVSEKSYEYPYKVDEPGYRGLNGFDNLRAPNGRLKRFQQLRDTVAPRLNALLNPPIYMEIRPLNRLPEFMHPHLFAVWE